MIDYNILLYSKLADASVDQNKTPKSLIPLQHTYLLSTSSQMLTFRFLRYTYLFLNEFSTYFGKCYELISDIFYN